MSAHWKSFCSRSGGCWGLCWMCCLDCLLLDEVIMGGNGVLWHMQLRETVQEKFMSEEALEEKRKEEARKKRWGPFGIFPGGK